MSRQCFTKMAVIMMAFATFFSANLCAKDIKISGDLMLDHDTFDAGFMEKSEDSQSLSEVRRARLSVKTKFADDWQAKLKIDFSNDNGEVKDAYIKYKGFNWADITLGQQKEGFGLEKRSSSSTAIMIERSLVTTALSPSRSIGASLAGGASAYNWQLGYYQPDENESATAITGRAAWLLWRQENELVHLGFAFSERDHNGSEFRINETMEVHTSDSLIEGEKIFADKESLQGVEFFWQRAGFTTLAEWQQTTVTDINNVDYDYQGGYVQFGYQLSGDNRKYKKGKIGKVSTRGWEFTSRYSQFELIEENREVQIYSIGVNYTVNKRLKLMADYIKAKQFDAGNEFDSSNAVSLRVQYSF
ncbi:MAG: OprO/OprP family phosphate-selective porin [Colwellia sp.]